MFESEEEKSLRRDNARAEALHITASLYMANVKAGIEQRWAMDSAKMHMRELIQFSQEIAEEQVP